ncbi:hypothetical protein B0T16DRAFT_414639 [Cercophora newfieldiana]|uniref:Uncharacterized protein n=1 Tax=Cercophora newfieldiana TaxID=92897 RepID=A0AA39Y6P3_9PEZI|nr:hypothetical protein B0T16DRAFT_414639 [Cercophora newfieldiana]
MTSSKRTILITGCSDGGLGAALALAFHKAGWRVFASARNVAKLKDATAAGIETIQLDTLSSESITAAIATVSSLTGGSLDALLNNAGGGYSMPITDVDIEKGKHLFDLNVWSVIAVTQAFLPLLFKSTHPSGGMIVNNTSCSSLIGGGLPFQVTYSASKAAITSFTEGMRMELKPFGIRVVNLVTGSVKSKFYANAGFEKIPPGSLYHIAADVIEPKMNGEEHSKTGVDTDAWAEDVVAQLNKKNPPHWIFGGKFSTLVRYGSMLPIGTFDFMAKPMVGLDVLEQRLKEAGGAKAVIGKLD